MRRFTALVCVSLVLAACGGSQGSSAPTKAGLAATPTPTAAATSVTLTNPPPTQIPGCLPQCWFGQLTRPGPLEGDYTTMNFFGGQMTVHVPNLWWGFEDSTGELSLGKKDREDFGLLFALDLYVAADAQGTPDEDFERSADGIIRFIEQEQGFEILDKGPATLGGLPAVAYEYRRADDAKNEDPGCPREIQPCIVEYGYPEWDGYFGEGSPFHSRIVIAKATWGGQAHAIYAIYWAEANSYGELVDTARAIIEGAVLPDGVAAAR